MHPRALAVLLFAAALSPAQAVGDRPPASESGQETPGGDNGGGTPRMVFENPVWDFGKQPQRTLVKHEYKLTNEGDGPLRILAVRPSCACNAAMPDKKVLKPGESTVIKASMDTKTFKGPLTKVITVTSNDPSNRMARLTVKGEVLPPFWISPSEVALGTLSKGEASRTREFRFVLSPGSEVDIKEVRTTTNHLVLEKVNEEPKERADGARELVYRVKLEPGMPVGIVRERVIFITNLPHQRSAKVAVNAEVKGEVRVSRTTFNLGHIGKGEQASREITVSKVGEPDLVLEEVAVRPDAKRDVFFAKVVAEEEPGRRYRVRVGVKPDAPAGYHRGKLIIRTNCRGEEVHQAYFYVFIRK